jgi:catechol 2,3-dioxygenase-like lactoylglutathione lyase family enzyme
MIKALDELEVITLFVEDLAAARNFYQGVFGLKIVYEDRVSAVVKMRNLLINLLHVSEADELMAPAPVAGAGSGARLLFTIKVDDVDAKCAELKARGIKLINGPIDRPWGRRTASFADPAGNVWEIAQDLK